MASRCGSCDIATDEVIDIVRGRPVAEPRQVLQMKACLLTLVESGFSPCLVFSNLSVGNGRTVKEALHHTWRSILNAPFALCPYTHLFG